MHSPMPPMAAQLQAAQVALMGGDRAKAKALLLAALQLAPTPPLEALILLGQLSLQEQAWAAAHDWFVRALQVNRSQPRVWFARGQALEQMGEALPAAAAFGEAARLQPDWGQAHYEQARLLRDGAQLPGALAAAREASRCLPNSADALQLQAMLEEETGALSAALVTLQAALVLAPQRASLHHNHGVSLQRAGRFAEALQAHQRAHALGLNIAHAHYNLANTQQSLGQHDEALASYRRALSLEPLHALSLYDLARLRWNLGHADFCEELERAECHHPQAVLPPILRGQLLLKAGQPQAALEPLQRALQIDPSNARTLDALAQAWTLLGDSSRAVAAHLEAQRLAPHDAAVHCNAARSLLAAQQSDLAEQSLQRALALAPQEQTAIALQGLLWRQRGDARAEWLHDLARCVGVLALSAPEGFADLDAFHAALQRELEAQHTDQEAPIDQTLRHGTQTRGNLFDQPLPLVQLLKRQIGVAIDAWLAERPDDAEHPFLGRRQAQWHFTDSWSSRLRSGGFHTNHVHGHGWLSCCYYVSIPPGSREAPGQAGWIQFGEPDLPPEARSRFPRLHAVQPLPGRLVLFPSYFWHGTLPFQDEGHRLTVAFDVMPGER